MEADSGVVATAVETVVEWVEVTAAVGEGPYRVDTEAGTAVAEKAVAERVEEMAEVERVGALEAVTAAEVRAVADTAVAETAAVETEEVPAGGCIPTARTHLALPPFGRRRQYSTLPDHRRGCKTPHVHCMQSRRCTQRHRNIGRHSLSGAQPH